MQVHPDPLSFLQDSNVFGLLLQEGVLDRSTSPHTDGGQ